MDTSSSLSQLFLSVYGLVLLAESIADKSLFTISGLAVRYRPVQVFFGISAAYICKVLFAVLLGSLIGSLPATVVALTTAATFFVGAALLHRNVPASCQKRFMFKTPITSFNAILFTEWADAGQLSVAALVARYQQPMVIWLAASLALITKGAMSILLGLGLRWKFSPQFLRSAAVVTFCILGVLSILKLILRT
jgi:putative Ca2+/H+ antiporter (TMEM165/GDT1 family)